MYENIARIAGELKLPASVSEIAQLAKESGADRDSIEFAGRLLALIQGNKTRRNLETLQKFSRIPVHKRLDDFNFAYQPSIDEQRIRNLATLGFLHNKENVIFIGDPGTGKSHLSIALAELCIEAGLKAYYLTMRECVEKINTALRTGTTAKFMKNMAKPSLLVIDEIGYQKLTQEQTELFFAIVSKRYEQGSMILTSNFPLSQWGTIFSSVAMAKVIVDRLAHHATIIKITGSSYRIKDRILQ